MLNCLLNSLRGKCFPAWLFWKWWMLNGREENGSRNQQSEILTKRGKKITWLQKPATLQWECNTARGCFILDTRHKPTALPSHSASRVPVPYFTVLGDHEPANIRHQSASEHRRAIRRNVLNVGYKQPVHTRTLIHKLEMLQTKQVCTRKHTVKQQTQHLVAKFLARFQREKCTICVCLTWKKDSTRFCQSK